MRRATASHEARGGHRVAAALLLIATVGALAAGGCGGDGGGGDGAPDGSSRPAPARVLFAGQGRTGATVFVPRGGDRGRVAVLFLHGWGAVLPQTYRPWIEHLLRRGHVVIHPRYQDSVLTPPPEVLGNATLGVRAALSRVRPRAVVAVGHSAGGALAADLAAIAARERLPAPRAVLSLYPGRSLRGFAPRIPRTDLSTIPRGTRVVALAGARDRVVGTRDARRIARTATRADASFTLVTDRRVSDHLGPQRADPASRAVFWRRLDRLIARSVPPAGP